MSNEPVKKGASAGKRGLISAKIGARIHGIQDVIEMIRRYLDSVTESINQGFRDGITFVRDLPDDLTEEEAEAYGEQLKEIHQDYNHHFPAFALETTFVATYALLEDEMMSICRLVGNRLKIKLGLEELKDKGITAAKTYLEKLCDITVPNERPWQRATRYGELRNVLAHARGRVKEGNTSVRTFVKDNAGKISIEEGRLHITKQFCLEVLDDVEELLQCLLRLAGTRTAVK